MNIIGITGNSGSGKSAVSKIISENGGYIIDADEISHNIILKGNEAYYKVLKEFGESILSEDGEINRKKLGSIVFNDKKSLEVLNEIMHRYITKEIKSRTEAAKKGDYKYIVIDAPLLTETNLHRLCGKVWVVYADTEKRLERIIRRDKISRELAQARLNNQTSFDELKKYADLIIDNSTDDYKHLKKEVLKKLSELE